jgi:DNA-binding transcriptional LysR family regulator
VLEGARRVEEVIRGSQGPMLDGKITIGTYTSLAVYFLPKFFVFMQKSQPGLKLNFQTASSEDLAELLRSERIDLAISVEPKRHREIIDRPLFDDTYSLYQHYQLGSRLADVPIFAVTSARDSGGKTIERFVKDASLSHQLHGHGDFEAVKAMLETGPYAGILPNRVARDLLQTKKIVPVTSCPDLMNFGRHSIRLSCKRKKMDDSSIRWIGQQLEGLLTDLGRS